MLPRDITFCTLAIIYSVGMLQERCSRFEGGFFQNPGSAYRIWYMTNGTFLRHIIMKPNRNGCKWPTTGALHTFSVFGAQSCIPTAKISPQGMAISGPLSQTDTENQDHVDTRCRCRLISPHWSLSLMPYVLADVGTVRQDVSTD